jgi:hypothetical protein
MGTTTDRVSLMRDALSYLCRNYATKREGDLAEADYYTPPEYGSALDPQAMRLRARAAVLADVLRDLKDVIHDPLYGPIVSPEGSEN